MKKWGTAGTILLLCLALVSTIGCGGGQEEVSQQLIEVVRGDLIVSISGSGNLVVSDEANLAFGSGGKIAKIYVAEGDKVRKGQSLARLDTGPLKLALAQAQAALDQAEYNLEQIEEPFSEDDINSAEAAVEAAEDYLEYVEWMLDKSEDAVEDAEEALAEAKQGGVPAEIAAAEAALATAEAAVEQWRVEASRAEASLIAAEVQLEAMLDAPDEGAVEAAEAQLEAAELAVTEAQKQLDEAVITAPFDGEVTSVHAEEGDIYSPTGMPVIHLIDPDTMEIEVEIDEIDIAEVEPGQKAIIEVDALPALQLEGEVASISLLSKKIGGLVLYEVTIGFDVPQGYNLKIGMSATADIILEERSGVLLVPDRAIQQDSQGNPIVKVIVNEEVEEIPVVIGISDGFDTEVVSGLSEGDVVVVETKTKSSSTGLF